MPSITCDKVVLDNLYKEISQSVVTIKRYSNTGFVNFFTGFIIYSTRSRVLVCADHTVLKEGEDVWVHFSDGSFGQAHEFIKCTPRGHAILSVQCGNRRRYPVSFSESQVIREEICTIAPVKHYEEHGFMTGIVVAPSGKTMLRSGRIITRYEKRFALTCPAERQQNVNDEGSLIGAAVFTLNGLVAGTVESADEAHGLKFAIHSSFFLDELERLLQDKDKKIKLLRGKTNLPRGSPRGSGIRRVAGKRSHEAQTAMTQEKRVKYAAKRHREEDLCRGSPR